MGFLSWPEQPIKVCSKILESLWNSLKCVFDSLLELMENMTNNLIDKACFLSIFVEAWYFKSMKTKHNEN